MKKWQFKRGQQVWESDSLPSQRHMAEHAYNRAIIRYRVSVGEVGSAFPNLGVGQAQEQDSKGQRRKP